MTLTTKKHLSGNRGLLEGCEIVIGGFGVTSLYTSLFPSNYLYSRSGRVLHQPMGLMPLTLFSLPENTSIRSKDRGLARSSG